MCVYLIHMYFLPLTTNWACTFDEGLKEETLLHQIFKYSPKSNSHKLKCMTRYIVLLLQVSIKRGQPLVSKPKSKYIFHIMRDMGGVLLPRQHHQLQSRTQSI